MAEYNIDNPLMFLSGTVTSTSITKRYEYDDASGLGPSGSNIGIEFEITISNIGSQLIGSDESRTGGSRQYTGLDVKTGDWLTNSNGTKCLLIISISSKSDSAVTLIARDVDAYSYKNYRVNQFTNNEACGIFEISDSGKPLIGGEDSSSFFGDKTAVDLLQSRFALQEEDERYKLNFDTPQTSVEVGQAVTIDSSGNLVPLGSVGANSTKLGIISGKSYGDTVVYIKPFNKIIDNYPKPENLDGILGDTYYASSLNPGETVTDPSLGTDKLYFQFKDAVPTVIQATSANLETQAGDTIVINGVPTVTGARTTSQLISDINSKTTEHFVTATGPTTEVSLESWTSGTPSGGDVYFVISADGGGTFTYPDVTIGDGTNSSTITFDTSDDTYPGFAQYLVVTANQMADELNTAFQADGVNLTAEAFISGNESNGAVFPSLRITAGSGYSINISGETGDTQGWTFTTANAMPSSATASTDVLLTLTRADGGDILLTGTGSFVNSNGIVSSSSGSPALLLMIEDEVGSATAGAETSDDLNQTPNVTTADGDDSGVVITHTPFSDSNVQILVNGVNVNLGDGAKDQPCYFSVDGGTTARAIADIEGGDSLYWNGSIAGYELDGTDEIDVIYDKTV